MAKKKEEKYVGLEVEYTDGTSHIFYEAESLTNLEGLIYLLDKDGEALAIVPATNVACVTGAFE